MVFLPCFKRTIGARTALIRFRPSLYRRGHKGKPLYRRGPRETEEQARGIVWYLQQRCGSGNYEYSVMLGEAGDIDRSFEE